MKRCLLGVLLCAGLLVAQPRMATTAANAWMKTSTFYTAHDDRTVSMTIRADRDNFWDNSIGAHPTPLTPETAARTAVSEGDYGPGRREIPIVPNRAIVIGTFTNARSILTESGRCIYTDITFLVDHVFETTNHSLSTNAPITLSIQGGTVATAAGHVLSYLTPPRSMFIQPSRRYLLFLSYEPSGDFFLMAADWDVTDGIVHPNDTFSMREAKRGNPG